MKSNKSEKAERWGLLSHVLSYVVVNVVQVVLWWTLTPEKFFWPLWSILAWGIGLAFHIWAVYSPSKQRARQGGVSDSGTV